MEKKKIRRTLVPCTYESCMSIPGWLTYAINGRLHCICALALVKDAPERAEGALPTG